VVHVVIPLEKASNLDAARSVLRRFELETELFATEAIATVPPLATPWRDPMDSNSLPQQEGRFTESAVGRPKGIDVATSRDVTFPASRRS
jgi:hypothetical protein